MVLNNQFTKLVVRNEKTGEIIASVTDELITTASDDIVVILTPCYNDEKKGKRVVIK